MSVGDAGVIEQPLIDLGDDLTASRGLDNRVGAFVALEALRLLAEGERPARMSGRSRRCRRRSPSVARTRAHSTDPAVAIVLDVTATDHPGLTFVATASARSAAVRRWREGSAVQHPIVHQRLVEPGRAESIPHASKRRRDAPVRTPTRSPTSAPVSPGLVSIPNRYMHSPSEIVSLTDLDSCAAIIAAFTRRFNADVDLRRVLTQWGPVCSIRPRSP